MINKIEGKILVSSCLLGLKTRYDGKEKPSENIIKLLKTKDIIFFCPEQAGGLPTPRKPSEIEPGKTAKDIINGDGKIFDNSGKDVTKEFLNGAIETLKICKKFNIKNVILKSKSPSCGHKKTYDGTFSGTLVNGKGITAELLSQNNINVFSEKDF